MPIYSAAQLVDFLKGRKTILNIGPPFTGKTRSLWTLVMLLKERNLGPLHVFDLDRKVESLVEALLNEPEAKAINAINHLVVHRIDVIDRVEGGAKKSGTNQQQFLQFQHEFNKFWDCVDTRTGTWKQDSPMQPGAIFIDSLSKLNEIIMEYVVGTIGHDLGEKGTDARNDYVKIMNKIKDVVDSLKTLPCMTGWIAHEQYEKDEILGRVFMLPNVSGKHTLAPSLAKEFNAVLVSTSQQDPQTKKIKYLWQVQPDGFVKSAGITGKTGLPLYIPQDYRSIL